MPEYIMPAATRWSFTRLSMVWIASRNCRSPCHRARPPLKRVRSDLVQVGSLRKGDDLIVGKNLFIVRVPPQLYRGHRLILFRKAHPAADALGQRSRAEYAHLGG